MKQVDYSNNANDILEIKHKVNNKEEIYIFNAKDENIISEWISNNIGEYLHCLNGCPIYMELSSWAYINAGADSLEYSLDSYTDIDSSEWEICLLNRN